MGRVSVVGSANVDHVVRLTRAPGTGETVAAESYTTSVGGKGLNQAVAAARAGADTQFVAAVGHDDAGELIAATIRAAGVDTQDLARLPDVPTGTAHILVDGSGDNRIAVVPGANGDLDAAWASGRVQRHAPAIVLLQLESDRDVVTAVAASAAADGVRVVLTPAPLRGQPLSARLLDNVTMLALNALEAAAVSGHDGDDVLDALLDLVPAVVLTLGADGARYADRDGVRASVRGRRVPVRDTTGAGDTFAGWFAACLADGDDPARALELANVAAGLSVGTDGAARAAPSRERVLRDFGEEELR